MPAWRDAVLRQPEIQITGVRQFGFRIGLDRELEGGGGRVILLQQQTAQPEVVVSLGGQRVLRKLFEEFFPFVGGQVVDASILKSRRNREIARTAAGSDFWGRRRSVGHRCQRACPAPAPIRPATARYNEELPSSRSDLLFFDGHPFHEPHYPRWLLP